MTHIAAPLTRFHYSNSRWWEIMLPFKGQQCFLTGKRWQIGLQLNSAIYFGLWRLLDGVPWDRGFGKGLGPITLIVEWKV